MAKRGTGTHLQKVREALKSSAPERVIAAGEQLTIETIADFARQIREGLAGADTVVIDLSQTVEVDITALQLFCSACQTAVAMEKKIINRGALPQSLLDLAAAAGSERQDHCKSNSISCFRKFGGTM